MNYLIRVKDGRSVGTVTTPQDPAGFAWPADESVEVFTDEASFEVRLDELAPAPGPDPDEELDAALADAASKATVEEKVDAMLAALRGQAGHAGRAAGRPTA